MSHPQPSLSTGVRPVHKTVLGAFHGEAALMRGFSWWVPSSRSFEAKLAAAHLAYLHMRNADTLYRLIGLLRVPGADEVFPAAGLAVTARVVGHTDLIEAARALKGSTPAHARALFDLRAGLPPLFDFHVVDSAAEVERRYRMEIEPALDEVISGTILAEGGASWPA
jgi:hypothetical protein